MTDELAVALSRYDLGAIESITVLSKGSRQSPKVGVVCERGKFLFKRLAPGRTELDRLRAKHRILRALVAAGFPAPRPISTMSGGQTFLQIRDSIYELYEFATGQSFSRSPDEARDAGAVLGKFHEVTTNLASDWMGPSGDYHDASGVRAGLCAIRSRLNSHDSLAGHEVELASIAKFLLSQYDNAADGASKEGIAALPGQVIHSDWHPGNLLFRGGRVQAVMDYDSVRLSRRVIDVANGALQFSIVGGGDPTLWPDYLDEACFRSFLIGYQTVGSLLTEEFACVPHLMAEALIAECVPPITRTGTVGRWDGFRVLQMVCRKLKWLGANGNRLAGEALHK